MEMITKHRPPVRIKPPFWRQDLEKLSSWCFCPALLDSAGTLRFPESLHEAQDSNLFFQKIWWQNGQLFVLTSRTCQKITKHLSPSKDTKSSRYVKSLPSWRRPFLKCWGAAGAAERTCPKSPTNPVGRSSEGGENHEGDVSICSFICFSATF